MQSRIIIILIPFLLLGCEKKKKYIEGYEIVKKDIENYRKYFSKEVDKKLTLEL